MTEQGDKPVVTLLPCPFCGERAEIEHSYHEDDNRYPRDFWHVRVKCQGCGIELPDWTSYGNQEQRVANFHVKQAAERDAASLWNTRHREQETLSSEREAGNHPDLEGRIADAVRDACNWTLGKVVSFDESRGIAATIMDRIKIANAEYFAALSASEGRDVGRERRDELRTRFQKAASDIHFVVEAMAKGYQFNAYERAGNDDDMDDEEREYRIGIGPITDFRVLFDVEGAAVAAMLEAALKLAALSTPPSPEQPDEAQHEAIIKAIADTMYGAAANDGQPVGIDAGLLREALRDGIDQLHWINAQAENAMATSAGAATSNGDQDGSLQMLNSIASDIGINAMMLIDKLTAALGEP